MRYFVILLFTAYLATIQGCSGLASKVSGNVGDRRSAGTQVEDETIENKSMARIQEKFKDSVQISVTSYNRFVLVTGDAPSEEAKVSIERFVYSVPNVKNLANEITVGALANNSILRSDLSISRDIRSSLNKDKSIQSGAFKVTASRGIVYLLGLVTHVEANSASEIASTTAGVQKVVRVFEYID